MIEDGEYEIDVNELLSERKSESSNGSIGIRYEFACDPVNKIQQMNVYCRDGKHFLNEKSEYIREDNKTAGYLLESEAMQVRNSYFLAIDPGQHQASLQNLSCAFLVRKREVPEKKFERSETLGDDITKSLSTEEQVSRRNRRKKMTPPLRRVGHNELKESRMKKKQQIPNSGANANTWEPQTNSAIKMGNADTKGREFVNINKNLKTLNLDRDEEFQDLEDQLEEVLNEDHKPEVQKDSNTNLTHKPSESESELDQDIWLNSSIKIEGPDPSQSRKKSLFNSANSSKPTSLQDFSGIIGHGDDSASEAD